MRLLNTISLQFEEFFDSQIPQYAILSHRWGDDEVTFQDFRKGRKQDGQGYAKTIQCCNFARSRDHQWVWIDTCCIDKKSSAELSEAINSMYRWYKGAIQCYVHLSDVVWNPQDTEASKRAFEQSLWFTRGWTLQELLAPSSVLFFDHQWSCFGTKGTLSAEVSAATGIEQNHLYTWAWFDVCIATKMSWVSRRVTSRTEDLAYCMLGLFDVNMPLLYGEGGKAFFRLQLEIIKKSDDESIFAWTSDYTTNLPWGMLALSPAFFAQSGDIVIHPNVMKKRFPYVMTNKGLEFHAPYQGTLFSGGEMFESTAESLSLALNCWRPFSTGSQAVTIKLIRLGTVWQRVDVDVLGLSESVQDSIGDAMSGNGKVKNTLLIYIYQAGL